MKKIAVFAMAALLAGFSPVYADMDSATAPKETAGVLSGLLEKAIDGQQGFQEAAAHASSGILRERFTTQSEMRAKFAEEIRNKMIELGTEPDENGSIAGKAHRAWVDVNTAVRKDDDKITLQAVKNGDGAALDRYREAMTKQFPEEIRDMIKKQNDHIQNSFDWTMDQLANINSKS